MEGEDIRTSEGIDGPVQRANPRLISIVVPAFNEATNIESLYTELNDVLKAVGPPWEIIFVDDGSTDGTWSKILGLHDSDKRIRGLRLSRNFGHQCALMAGLNDAAGDVVISMDADLQHPPAVIPKLVDEWRHGSKIVNTICEASEDASVFKKLSSRGFYWVFARLSGVRLERGMADFRLIDRQVLDDILRLPEDPLFLRGIVEWIGYPSARVTFRARSRLSGSTKYTLRRMLRLAWQGVSSFDRRCFTRCQSIPAGTMAGTGHSLRN